MSRLGCAAAQLTAARKDWVPTRRVGTRVNVSGRTYPVDVRYWAIELIEEDDETRGGLW